MLVPIAVPQGRLPHGVSVNSSSLWHTSAMVATALESVALPSRLKDEPNRDTIGTITELLNVMGKQTVANLRMSVTETSRGLASAPPPDKRLKGEGEGHGTGRLELDIDFSPSDEAEPTRQNGSKPYHLFGQAVTLRGDKVDREDDEDAEDADVTRQRHAQQPVSRR